MQTTLPSSVTYPALAWFGLRDWCWDAVIIVIQVHLDPWEALVHFSTVLHRTFIGWLGGLKVMEKCLHIKIKWHYLSLQAERKKMSYLHITTSSLHPIIAPLQNHGTNPLAHHCRTFTTKNMGCGDAYNPAFKTSGQITAREPSSDGQSLSGEQWILHNTL